jgi:hypothetical protein
MCICGQEIWDSFALLENNTPDIEEWTASLAIQGAAKANGKD